MLTVVTAGFRARLVFAVIVVAGVIGRLSVAAREKGSAKLVRFNLPARPVLKGRRKQEPAGCIAAGVHGAAASNFSKRNPLCMGSLGDGCYCSSDSKHDLSPGRIPPPNDHHRILRGRGFSGEPIGSDPGGPSTPEDG